jgi:uncharacterized damage-inducible protein DinB
MHEGFLENYRWLARYNAWMNERLYDACGQLPEQERLRDRGAFFGSIHRTLNHLLWGDRMWLQRFANQGLSFRALEPSLLTLPAGAVHETVLYEDWDALRQARQQLDTAIERWTREMPAEFPATTMRYSNTRGIQREHPAWKALTHFFNHQAHHRGQVTTLLMQAGVDVGLTDLIAMSDEPGRVG